MSPERLMPRLYVCFVNEAGQVHHGFPVDTDHETILEAVGSLPLDSPERAHATITAAVRDRVLERVQP